MVRSIQRTAVPVWSPSTYPSTTPLLATGTVSGALDASFSSDSVLELWDPYGGTQHEQEEDALELSPVASLNVGSRFNRLAWGYVKYPERPRGVIAAGLENGEIALWDPSVMLGNKSSSPDPLIARYDLHKGPVRGLDFNPHQPNLLASGATNGEIFIWDLTTPNKPFSPGARSRSIEDITCLAWNSHVVHVLATGSNSGYTVVWDLKSKREVTALSYSAGAPTGVGAGFGTAGWSAGGSRSVSAVQWHPDNPTKLVTASDDDHNPVIMLWDLRNWKEPEKVMAGHEKGILSLSWCQKDADLLLSSGKDGRTIAWNPTSGEIVAEVTPSSNWSFETQWCPRNPSILATASLDGKISLHSIQSTAQPTAPSAAPAASLAPGADGSNLFDEAISANAANYPTKSLSQPPKWLRRPASAAFGFGGKLVCVSNAAPSAPGAPSVPTVTVRRVTGAPEVAERARRLDEATANGQLSTFCEQRSAEVEQASDMSDEIKRGEVASWKLLGTLFNAQSKGELVELLGFNKSDVKSKVREALKSLGGGKDKMPAGFDAASEATSVGREPLVTFADTPTDGMSASSVGEGALAGAGSNEVDDSAASTSVASYGTNKLASSEAESEVTEPSLFGDDNNTLNLTPSTQSQAAADFYSQIGSGRPAALPDHVFGRDAAANSSVAATIGSSSSSVASLNVRSSTFKIYREDESDVDRLITRALVLGDFESAVALAISTDRFADAILFAVRGGSELLARTQKMYFDRQTESAPYLRVLQSIVGNDLTDVVQNANLADWQEAFVVACTYASPEEFATLAEQLGQRLEFQYEVAKTSPVGDSAPELRKNATLCYLAAGKLEKVIGIWIQQMNEDEGAKEGDAGAHLATNKYKAHAKALQTFVEKVSVFQQAVGYVDSDLTQPPAANDETGVRDYKLADLYELYVEYAELLAAQGLADIALKYIAQTPVDFKSKAEASTRDRLVRAAGGRPNAGVYGGAKQIGGAPIASTSATPYGASVAANSAYAPYTPAASGYGQPTYTTQSAYPPPMPSYQQQPPQQQQQTSPYTSSQQNNLDDPYGPASSNPYAPKSGPVTNAYQPVQQSQQANGSAYSPYGAPPPPPAQQQSFGSDPYAVATPAGTFVPPPPGVREQSPNFASRLAAPASVPPPPRAKPEVQWNDAPVLQRKNTPSATSAAANKAAAITSPFPNSGPSSPMPSAGGYGQLAGGTVPPPPPSRGSNRTPAPVAPPPQSRPGGGYAPPPPPPSAGASSTNMIGLGQPPAPSPYAPPPPPPQQQQQQQQSMPPPPPPQSQQRFQPPPPPPTAGSANAQRPPPPPQMGQGQQAQQHSGNGAPTPPQLQAGQFRPQSANANRPPFPGPPRPNGAPGQPQQQQAPPPPPPGPYAPQQNNAGPYAPPPGPGPGGPNRGPPQPSFNQPPSGPGQAAPAPPPPRPEPPKPKYPPGDTSHIPAASKPIFDILSARLNELKSLPPGPPQQAKVIADTGKRLGVLFDMLNCETLSPASTSRVLEICRAIEARNKALALDLHLQMITAGAPDVGPFQAAIKLVIQRMQ